MVLNLFKKFPCILEKELSVLAKITQSGIKLIKKKNFPNITSKKTTTKK